MDGSLFILSKKRLPKARVSSFRSQYHAVVKYSPCATAKPRLWTLLTKTSRPAGFMVLVMPNSFADFKELMKSSPALARPRTCALDLCACSRNDEKSDVDSGTRTAPKVLPPLASTTFDAAACSCAPKV